MSHCPSLPEPRWEPEPERSQRDQEEPGEEAGLGHRRAKHSVHSQVRALGAAEACRLGRERAGQAFRSASVDGASLLKPETLQAGSS